MKQQLIRLTVDAIAPAMALVWRVFAEFEAPEYAPEGVAEFKRFIAQENIAQKMQSDSMVMWGWYQDDTLAGVLAVTVTGHINLLFVDAAYQRQGIAKALHKEAIRFLKSRKVACVTVNSSPFAVEIYRRLGFVPTSSEQTVNGIRFTPMAAGLAMEDSN